MFCFDIGEEGRLECEDKGERRHSPTHNPAQYGHFAAVIDDYVSMHINI